MLAGHGGVVIGSEMSGGVKIECNQLSSLLTQSTENTSIDPIFPPPRFGLPAAT